MVYHSRGMSVRIIYRRIKKIKACCKVVMICILLVQIVTLGTLCITTDGLKSKNSAAFSDKNEFVYSDDENVIVLVLDMYDSQVFQAIYEEEGNEKYLNAFDGFTYYPDTLGMYSSTYCAIPHILTGEKYLGDIEMEEYVNITYQTAPLFAELQKENYDINIYTNEAVPTAEEAYGMISNYLSKEESSVSVSSKRKMLTYIGKLVGIRYLPQPLKKYCWFYSSELWDVRTVNYEDKLYSLNNYTFEHDINEMVIASDNNTFHFYHIEGVHPPVILMKTLIKLT